MQKTQWWNARISVFWVYPQLSFSSLVLPHKHPPLPNFFLTFYSLHLLNFWVAQLKSSPAYFLTTPKPARTHTSYPSKTEAAPVPCTVPVPTSPLRTPSHSGSEIKGRSQITLGGRKSVCLWVTVFLSVLLWKELQTPRNDDCPSSVLILCQYICRRRECSIPASTVGDLSQFCAKFTQLSPEVQYRRKQFL